MEKRKADRKKRNRRQDDVKNRKVKGQSRKKEEEVYIVKGEL